MPLEHHILSRLFGEVKVIADLFQIFKMDEVSIIY